MTTMVQNIGLPAEVAAQYNLATMWQAWEFLVAYMKGDFTDKVDEAIANSCWIKLVHRLIVKKAQYSGKKMQFLKI